AETGTAKQRHLSISRTNTYLAAVFCSTLAGLVVMEAADSVRQSNAFAACLHCLDQHRGASMDAFLQRTSIHLDELSPTSQRATDY
ncbi:hypothetical protein JMJ77_0000067, partial [Colletotrichum scovillei]